MTLLSALIAQDEDRETLWRGELWNDTIEAHKNALAEAVMDKTAELATHDGLHSLTMARIA